MFRVKRADPPELLRKHIQYVKTGPAGHGLRQLDPMTRHGPTTPAGGRWCNDRAGTLPRQASCRNGSGGQPGSSVKRTVLWQDARARRHHARLPRGRMIGLIGPDGVGKSSLLSLIAGARARCSRGASMRSAATWQTRPPASVTCPRIAYMPQGLGKNLYPTLSVFENVDFFGRLFGHGRRERERRIGDFAREHGACAVR
jgi:hypothetical protein